MPDSETSQDVRDLLSRDHDDVRAMAGRMIEARGGERRRAILKELRIALTAHSRAEETTVYKPVMAVETGNGAEFAREGMVEHAIVDDLLLKLLRSRKPDSEDWKAMAIVLAEVLERHIAEEQEALFAALAVRFDAAERAAMAERFERARQRLRAVTP